MDNLLRILLPGRCAVCGRELLAQESFLCTFCVVNMPMTYFWSSGRNAMAEKLNARIQVLRDKAGRTFYEPYITAAALFFYRGDYKRLTQALKYDAEIPLGKYLSQALGRKLSASGEFRDVDLVVPVPLHWWRRYRRGYNQAEIIARAIASCTGAEVDADSLRRIRYTRSQARLEVGEKSGNVAGAFAVRYGSERITRARHILLVDDVCTTGATLAECCFALRSAVVDASVRISVVTLAYVGE